MKKILLVLCLIISAFLSRNAWATEQPQNTEINQLEASVEKQSSTNAEIDAFLQKFTNLRNKKNILSLKKLYTDDFVNADGLNKKQFFELVNKTFSNYPDLKTDFEVKEIIANGEYAMISLAQRVSATTKTPSKITNDNGVYSANLHSLLYLKKINQNWFIYSENVIYENSILAFGSAKQINATINAPQKVLANADYCAGVNIDIPQNLSAIASVNNSQITQNPDFEAEKFRQVPLKEGSLERILKSNNNNNNEAVIISVAFTEQTEDMFKKPKIDISGLLILMKRVDVIPQNSETKNDKIKE